MFELDKGSITWNLGDTSFRRKALINDYRILLKELYELKLENNNEWNFDIQAGYYNNVRTNQTIKISSEVNELDKMAKMGRTFTSGLFKLGFCDKKRNLTDIGLQLLNLKKIELDELEKRLRLKSDNILFLRQLLKMYIWDKDVDKGFNPFIFLIKVLNRYEYLSKDEFESIIQVSSGKTDFEKIMVDFEKVRNKEVTLEEFFNNNIRDNQTLKEIDDFIKNEELNEEVFKTIFYNRKTSSSKQKYLDFYKQLIIYKDNTNNQKELDKLIKYLTDDVIKKAFNIKNLFPRIPKKIKCDKFIEKYSKIKLISLNNEEFRSEFLGVFSKAKREDIVKEYRDMTYRIFNITGILNFRNNTIKIDNLYAKEYFKSIDDELNISIDTKNEDISKVFSMNQILRVNKVIEVDNKLKIDYKLNSESDILDYLNEKEKIEVNEFIKREFDKNKVIELLDLISKRKDNEVYEMVTDQATVPTIFEYVLAIAWWYISECKFNLLDSLNLTLDSNYYPLSHAAGGDGDIVIDYKEPERHKLMLEATLMDINTQKRGELEPVIRHSVNLKTFYKKNDIETYNIFVANELDNNVINIFRVCNLLNLESSLNKGEFTRGTKIVAFKIEEIIRMLRKNISYNKVLEVMKEEFENDKLENANSGWRDKFIRKIV